MALYLINGEKQRIIFQNDRTSVLSYPAFPGGNVWRFQNEKVDLLFKEILTGLYSIRYKIFRFTEPQKIESVSNESGMHSRVMLQNELHLSVDTIGEWHQREGTVSLLSGKVGSCKAAMEKEVEYRALDIFAGKDLAAQLVQVFPEADFETEKVRNLFPYPCFISPALHKVIDEILDCPFDAATSPFYFDVKVREYFFLLLKECTGLKELKYRFTPFEMDGLVQARELLLSDLSKPPLTIRQLAHKVGMNEFKLKAGFAQFYKTGVFECFQRARMYKAKQLLLQTNKPIKDICTMAGYPRMTNFITAFRKFFGNTPGALRR